ncbi:expansin EXLX1 family cellulose-binding protein [Streptomyces prunicolor]|uniref:Expansin EXLX1 family cellulose-binding protein n=1 Tax=Streptomyces prunicolor TaxID=67348 RepID=A0ABU4F6J6_9ACTN|nr:expansin EXLX1 family cellulose-binding protein [Streptomyces prunicolor]MDV7216212.1 expansin EXLX1 family cellulose-binding protein [Streptomyces prunicolor]
MSKRWLFLSAAAVLIVVSLALVLLPGHKDDETVKAEAGSAVTEPSATGSSPANSPSPSGSSTASARATAASKKPSATPSARATTKPAATSATKVGQQASGTASLAGRIRPGVTYRGVATFYDADGGGACMYDPSGDVMTGAMNSTDYESSKACGAYVLVHAANGASITVRITNECPGDCAPGQIDLSAQAFAKLAAPSAGRIPITWNLASPSTSDTISIRYKTGSTRYWCGIQAIGHRNPLARLEVRAGSSWRQLERADYNYFLSEDGSGCGGALRLTDIYGQQLTVPALAVRANVTQPTQVQFAKH